MIRLEVNNGAFVEDYEVADVPTCAALIAKFQNDHRFRWAGPPSLMDASQSRVMSDDDEITDGRYYHLTVWIGEQLDEEGNTIGRAILP